MRRGRSFPESAEFVLICCLVIGFVAIAQRYSQLVFQLGLVVVVVSTFLEIGVGNLPIGSNVGRSLGLIALTLAITSAVFGVGILLVPYLTMLGR